MSSGIRVPRYLEIAEDEIGIKEVPGTGNHPRILEYHATTTLGNWAKSKDSVPWCSSFVNWAVTNSGLKGTDNALARSWMTWGEPVDEPRLGDIVVIKRLARGRDRRTGSFGGYHVAFYVRRRRGRLRLLGGNQANSVKFSNYSLRRYEIKAVRRWSSSSAV